MFENGIMQSNMFREMRRKRQLLPVEISVGILERMTNGTLALHGDDGYPYAVPSVMCMPRARYTSILP